MIQKDSSDIMSGTKRKQQELEEPLTQKQQPKQVSIQVESTSACVLLHLQVLLLQATSDLNLLYGLDDRKPSDLEWLQKNMRQHNDQVASGVISFPSFPLVKNKTLRIEVVPHEERIFVIFERKHGFEFDNVKLTIGEYEAFCSHFEEISEFIKAVQAGGSLDVFTEGLVVKPDVYGWKFCRKPLVNDLMLTLTWHVEKRYALVKVHRGKFSRFGGTWYPDKKNEACLCSGGMQYLIKYVADKADAAIQNWKEFFERGEDVTANLVFSAEEMIGAQPAKEYEEEMQKAVFALNSDPEWSSGWH